MYLNYAQWATINWELTQCIICLKKLPKEREVYTYSEMILEITSKIVMILEYEYSYFLEKFAAFFRSFHQVCILTFFSER